MVTTFKTFTFIPNKHEVFLWHNTPPLEKVKLGRFSYFRDLYRKKLTVFIESVKIHIMRK